MDTLETLYSRRSVRGYTGEPPTERELAVLLQAANAAPIARGRYETVHLTVIRDPALLAQIDRNAAAFFGDPAGKPLYGAPMLIVISAEKPAPGGENVTYSNAAIVAHNICLAAVELGLGQCCIWGAIAALSKNDALVQALAQPQGFVPCCAVSVGKTAEVYARRDIPTGRIGCNVIDP